MPDIDNPDLIHHENRISAQIEYARQAYAQLNADEDVEQVNNEDVLTMLNFLAEAGYRLEPDDDGIMKAARDHMLADKADFISEVMSNLPPEVQAVIDAAKEAGMNMAVIAVQPGECTNPACPVHHPG